MHRKLGQTLVGQRGWRWYGVMGDQVMSPGSQQILSVKEAAKLEGLLDTDDDDKKAQPGLGRFVGARGTPANRSDWLVVRFTADALATPRGRTR